jgi:hypothetical protein
MVVTDLREADKILLIVEESPTGMKPDHSPLVETARSSNLP